MVHVEDALTASGHLTRGASLLLAELALGALVTEDLDLAVAPLGDVVFAVSGVLDVGVDLEVEGQALHPLLQGEVGGEALDRKGDEGGLLATNILTLGTILHFKCIIRNRASNYPFVEKGTIDK